MPGVQRDDLRDKEAGFIGVWTDAGQSGRGAPEVGSGYPAGEKTPDRGRADPATGRLWQEHRLVSKGWQRLLQGREGQAQWTGRLQGRALGWGCA